MRKFEEYIPRLGKCVTFNKELYVNTLEQDVNGSYIFEGDFVDITWHDAFGLNTHRGLVSYLHGAFGVLVTPNEFVQLVEMEAVNIIAKHGTREAEPDYTAGEKIIEHLKQELS